ncbi:MAG: oxygen-independent coproporphyrinogen III oxidase [Alphaproteobacteria bacterium]|nr:oxygen-independent coproporphyrinogen III oxidase [Alphaproteobacteria bacterium]
MSMDRVSLAESRVPRYTSYPTAAQFGPGVGRRDVAAWLGRLDPRIPVSVYAHIPFCRQLCWYCGCHTSIVSRDAPVAAYHEVLLRELDLVASLAPARLPLSHLHFGGGTPTILTPGQFGALMARIGEVFEIRSGAEIAVEIDPRGLDEARVAALAASGVNRVSLGIQDLDPGVQAAINRHQPLALVADCVAMLRRYGLERISMDLIYGLPRQTPETLRRTVRDVAALAPDRVSLFGYAHVPWMKSHQRLLEPSGLPDAPERLVLSDAATAALLAAGYEAIGIDHFARPGDSLAEAARAGTLHRNFQGYTTDRAGTLIGIGASAISTFPGGFAQNAARLDDWRDAIQRGELATARGVRLTDDDRRRSAIIEALMCNFTVDIAPDIAADPTLAEDLERLEPLVAAGLAARIGTRVTIPPEGRQFARIVAATFDRYLKPEAPRHAAAV